MDVDFEMTATGVKSREPKFTWEIVGIYRAPNDEMRVMKKLAARTGYTGISTKRSIIGGDLNLPYADWNGNVSCNSRTEELINSLVWENWFTQIVDITTIRDGLLNVTSSGPKLRSPLAA